MATRKLFERCAGSLVEDSTDNWRLLSTHRPTRFQEIEYSVPGHGDQSDS